MSRMVYRPDHPSANGNGMIDADIAPPRVQRFGNAPFIISDIMPDTRHMANGKMYASKSEFRKATKAAGCVEVGNDSSLFKDREPIKLDRRKRRDDISRAVQQIRERSSSPRKRRRRK